MASFKEDVYRAVSRIVSELKLVDKTLICEKIREFAKLIWLNGYLMSFGEAWEIDRDFVGTNGTYWRASYHFPVDGHNIVENLRLDGVTWSKCTFTAKDCGIFTFNIISDSIVCYQPLSESKEVDYKPLDKSVIRVAPFFGDRFDELVTKFILDNSC